MKLEVAVGELIDKLTILRIKSEKITDPEKLKFIQKEFDILFEMVEPLTKEYPELSSDMMALYKVNRLLWDIENAIRNKEQHKVFDQEFISLARSVYQNNDSRAKIKYNINVYTNSNLREVKQYTEYNV